MGWIQGFFIVHSTIDRTANARPLNSLKHYIYKTSDSAVILPQYLLSLELQTDLMSHRKWNESGFRPPLCTYRLNWARRTSWGWWDDWDDTVLQTQDSKFEPWRSEALGHGGSPQYWLSHVNGEETFFFQTAETGNRTPNSGVKGSGANHYPRAPALSHRGRLRWYIDTAPPNAAPCRSALRRAVLRYEIQQTWPH